MTMPEERHCKQNHTCKGQGLIAQVKTSADGDENYRGSTSKDLQQVPRRHTIQDDQGPQHDSVRENGLTALGPMMLMMLPKDTSKCGAVVE